MLPRALDTQPIDHNRLLTRYCHFWGNFGKPKGASGSVQPTSVESVVTLPHVDWLYQREHSLHKELSEALRANAFRVGGFGLLPASIYMS